MEAIVDLTWAHVQVVPPTGAVPQVAKQAGGLSGAPVHEPANAVIRRAYARSGGALPIIGMGGVFTAEDVYEKLRAGASVVQVYTGFIYEGRAWCAGCLRA